MSWSANEAGAGANVRVSANGLVFIEGNPNTTNNTGKVTVRTISNGNVSLRAVIDGNAPGDNFGKRVAISDDGSVIAFSSTEGTGSVYVYEWDGSGYSQRGSVITEVNSTDYGSTIALNGNGNVISIYAPNPTGSNEYAGNGFIQTFDWSGTEWIARLDIVGQDGGSYPTAESGKGLSLSTDGYKLAVGAPGYLFGIGLVRVYSWTGTEWTQLGGDIQGSAYGDYIGENVAIKGDGTCLAVSYNTNANVFGVRLFDWTSNTWVPRADIFGGSPNFSVTSDFTVFAFGLPSYSSGSGLVLIYQPTAPTATLVRSISPISSGNGGFGESIAIINANAILIGSPVVGELGYYTYQQSGGGGGGDGTGTGGGGGGGATGTVTFPFILQQTAGANLDVAGETVTNTLVPHVYLDYYGIDFSNVFSQNSTDANRVAVSLSSVDSDFVSDISGFLSDVEQSLRTFNKWLGGYDHREFESTACTSLEGLTAGLNKVTAANYTSNVFEQLVGIDASSISLDASGAMSFNFSSINEFHVVSRVSTAYSISIDHSKAFSISGMPAEITIDYASANPVSASRPWYVLTRIHRAAGTNAIQYDTTGAAPDN